MPAAIPVLKFKFRQEGENTPLSIGHLSATPDFWYFRISRKHLTPGLKRYGVLLVRPWSHSALVGSLPARKEITFALPNVFLLDFDGPGILPPSLLLVGATDAKGGSGGCVVAFLPEYRDKLVFSVSPHPLSVPDRSRLTQGRDGPETGSVHFLSWRCFEKSTFDWEFMFKYMSTFLHLECRRPVLGSDVKA